MQDQKTHTSVADRIVEKLTFHAVTIPNRIALVRFGRDLCPCESVHTNMRGFDARAVIGTHNGKLDAGDGRWSEFKVMVDGGMKSLDTMGIASIDLTPKGTVGDVVLAFRNLVTTSAGARVPSSHHSWCAMHPESITFCPHLKTVQFLHG